LYAPYPHSEHESKGQVYRRAYEFNLPVILQKEKGSSIETGHTISATDIE